MMIPTISMVSNLYDGDGFKPVQMRHFPGNLRDDAYGHSRYI
jgi:hypothetical protein